MRPTKSPSLAGKDAIAAASDLAFLLRLARIYVASTRPRVCAACGHLFTLPSLTSGRHCARCAIGSEAHP